MHHAAHSVNLSIIIASHSHGCLVARLCLFRGHTPANKDGSPHRPAYKFNNMRRLMADANSGFSNIPLFFSSGTNYLEERECITKLFDDCNILEYVCTNRLTGVSLYASKTDLSPVCDVGSTLSTWNMCSYPHLVHAIPLSTYVNVFHTCFFLSIEGIARGHRAQGCAWH